MLLNIPISVGDILLAIENSGFEAYIVGGCVRDLLMGKTPDDYDITTNALPKEIKSVFKNTADTGIKHGTVTVIDGNNTPFEVTTYRTESGYSDMRHPADVKFVSDIKEDLSRRDFTVNAMAFNKKCGLVDYFGGIGDLNKKILRAVGNPEKRFSEDALRILRLFRFSSTLGFKIERKTKSSALRLCKNLEKISAERVASELIKAVSGKNPNALKPLIKKGGLKYFGIKNCRGLKLLNKLDNKENLRFFAFLYLCDCDCFEVIKNLKLSNAYKKYFEDMLKLNFINNKSSDSELKLALSVADAETIYDYFDFLSIKTAENFQEQKQKIKKIIDSAEPYKISHLKINGDDLLKLGYKDKEIGTVLQNLCETVRKNPDANKKEALLKMLDNK
ncbi:MAG: CCA tRNA nucleotidyltransferase [Clostridia bacterium]|nr:CCA tRNA nucleotidyltransferase [Clostridia bacterium]